MKLSNSKRNLLLFTLLFQFMLVGSVVPALAEEKPAEAAAEAPKPSATFSTDILSQYLFRGIALSKDSAVVQPSLAFSWYGFTMSVWGNLDTSQQTNNPLLLPANGGYVKNDKSAHWNETDFTLAYSREIFKDFSITLGNTYYSLDYARFDTYEVFGGASYAFPWFTVAFTTFKEVSHTPGWWMQLDITKSFPLPYIEGMSLDLGAQFGYMILEDDDTTLDSDGTLGSYSEPHAGTITAALKIPCFQYFTVAPKLGVAFPLSDNASHFIKANSFDSDDVHVFGGINLTASF